MKQVIQLNNKDNVVTAIKDLTINEKVIIEGYDFFVKENVPLGFKIALVDFEINSPVFKYGEVIGITTDYISKGEIVHTHNLKSSRGNSIKGE